MNMSLEEAIKVLDISTRREALKKYGNIAEANDKAIRVVLDALKFGKDLIFNAICGNNLEGDDDEIVVIEIATLRTILDRILGANGTILNELYGEKHDN